MRSSTSTTLLPEVLHVEHLGLEARAVALVAGHVHVGHEDHLDLDVARALALLAAAALHVEAEGARGVLALPGERHVGEDAPDLVERLDVRHGVRARRAADGLLVHEHHVVERLVAAELVERADAFAEMLLGRVLAGDALLERPEENVVDERALAAPRDAGDRGERADRNLDVHAAQVVLARAGEADPARTRLAAFSGSGMVRAPVRYCPVSGLFAASEIGPVNTTRPPFSPLSGPSSIIQSAMRIASRSCSTTITVFPPSRSRASSASRRSMSRGCRPMLGSSSTYVVSTRCAPSEFARPMRCASPPESVRVVRSSVR